MISSLLSSVTSFIIHTISTLGYPGVALLMAIQSCAIPMPSEVILPFAGSLIVSGKFNLFLLALTGAVGSALGQSLAYYIGYKEGRPLVEKYGKYILVSHRDLDLGDRFFNKFGSLAAFIGQLLPVIRSFVGFPAGIAKVPYKKYIAYAFLGSFVWSLMLGYIGMKLGEHWESLHSRFQKFDIIIVVLILLLAALWVYRHVKHRRKK